MLSFDPTTNTERENYKLLIGSIVPRPIAFVTSITKDGTINAAPFSYFNVVSSHPPMISISVQRKNGVSKDTARNIIESQEFVVHIVDEQNVEAVNTTAASLPPEESEIKRANLSLVDSESVSVPGVKEAKVRFECILEQAITLDNEEEIGTDLLIGKVVHYHIDEQIYEDGKINHHTLGAVSRLAGSDYATIGDVFSIERPK